MSLVTILSNKPAKKVQCLTCDWLSGQSAEDVAAIKAAIANPDWSTSELWRVLCDAGYVGSQPAFRSHVVAGH